MHITPLDLKHYFKSYSQSVGVVSGLFQKSDPPDPLILWDNFIMILNVNF